MDLHTHREVVFDFFRNINIFIFCAKQSGKFWKKMLNLLFWRNYYNFGLPTSFRGFLLPTSIPKSLDVFLDKINLKKFYTSVQYIRVFRRNFRFFVKICSNFRIFKWIFIPIGKLFLIFFEKVTYLFVVLNNLVNFEKI